MNTLIAIGGLGGVIVLLGAIIAVGRGVFRQISATEENTDAVKKLTADIGQLQSMFHNHETRIAVLEDRIGR